MTFTPEGEFEGVVPVPASDINPTAEPNKYDVRLSLSAGQHRVVLMANMSDYVMWAPPNSVLVGDLLWATTNVAEPGTFADTPYRYDFKSSTGGWDYQYTWYELTGATDGNTVAGYCPDGWRLPTQAEYVALVAASNYAWVTTHTNPADGSIVNGGEFTITATGQKLFFPASGYYRGTKLSTHGYYRSSIRSYSNSRYSVNLLVVSGGNDPQYAYDISNDMGGSVRCVRDAGPETRAATRVVVDDMRGQSYEDIMAELVGDGEVKMYETGGSIPMWGDGGIVTAAEDNDIHIELHRAVAKVNVGAGAYDKTTGAWVGLANFEMTSVTVVRPNDRYQVIPAAANLDNDPDNDILDGRPVAPTIPAETEIISVEDSVAKFVWTTTAGAPIVNQIYLPEAALTDPALAYTDRMALVVGGKYNGSTDPLYYRVDFERNGALIDVVRNNLYRFDITSVHGPGSTTVKDAYNSYASYMNVSVVGWNEIDMPTEL